ncbi:MAG TPA: hypothetical protein VD907_02000 [Verrucomicrobiae bacterium]|nr:hypothetical protein [Verrucomicrobiae bacterium]
MDQQPVSPQKQRNRMILFTIVVAILAVVGIIVAILSANRNDAPKPAAESSNLEKTFYESLANASQQQRIRVAMLRKTYANAADAAANKNVGVVASTVSEIDVAAGKYRNVFANKNLGKDVFTLGRCIDGTDYIDLRNASEEAKTLQEANQDLLALSRVTENLQFVTCKRVGLYPQAVVVDLAPARINDGVFPVTLKPAQAKTWEEEMIKADLFTVTDEGEQTFEGKKVRKISFAPKGDGLSVNQTLYQNFFKAAEIQKLKAENNPDAQYDYAFISINASNSGGVKGFYLIDETTKLPVYSELMGVNKDREAAESDSVKRLNIGVTKQTYSYPPELTLDEKSQLEILQ